MFGDCEHECINVYLCISMNDVCFMCVYVSLNECVSLCVIMYKCVYLFVCICVFRG